MDFWLQFALAIVKGVLAGLHVDLSKATLLKTVLIGLANDIYLLYNMVPPAPPTQ